MNTHAGVLTSVPVGAATGIDVVALDTVLA